MGRKSRAEERRPEILENAYRVAEVSGLQNMTLSAIARRMGVATSLLTHYFKSKDDIVISLIHYMVEKYDQALILDFKSISDPYERLEAILDSRLMEYSRLVIEDKVWYEVFAMAFRNEKILKHLTTLYQRDIEYLVSLLNDLLPQHRLPRKTIEDLAKTINIMMEGANAYYGATGDAEGTHSAVIAMKEMFINYFKGLTTRH